MAAIGKKIAWKDLKFHWTLYLFIIPTVILIALFQYYPASSGIFHSFYRWNGADIAEYVGVRNYLDIMKNAAFWNSFEVAFTIGIWNVIKMIPALMVAVCLNRVRSESLQFLYRVFFVIQMVIPGLVVVLIWRTFFFEATNGYLNKFLVASGLFDFLVWMDATFHWGGIFAQGQLPAWIGDPRLILIACIVWGFPWIGSFAVLNYLARLQSIPKEIYEAGDVDGVGFFSKFTEIELPLITESIKIMLVLVIIETIKDAGMILALAGMTGGPGGVVTVPALFMLRKAFIDQDMGFACAIGIILTVIVFLLQKFSNMISVWGSIKGWKRFLIRLGGLAAGVALLYYGRFIAVGIALVVVSFPYGAITNTFRTIVARIKEARPQKAMVKKYLTDAQIARENFVGLLLRASKHLWIVIVLLLAFLPIYLMAIVSLKTNAQFYLAPAIPTAPFHFENWGIAWENIMASVANSVFIAISSTFVTLFVALCAAYFFARNRMPLSGFIWNAIIILMMMPSIANMIPLFRLLKDMNLLNTLSSLIIVGASGGQIFAIFVLRSFVEDIPRDLFEAAEIDGANHFQQMMIVVLPLAGPILGTVGIMHFIGQWNDFLLPLIVIRDQARLPVMVQLLRMSGEYIKLWGPLMAGYAFSSLPLVVLFIFTMKLFAKGMTEGGVKG